VPDEKALKIRVFRQFLGESDENCQTRLTKSGWVTRFTVVGLAVIASGTRAAALANDYWRQMGGT